MRVILIAVCLLLAAPAWSAPVDPDNPDGIASCYFSSPYPWLLRTDGQVYVFTPQIWEWDYAEGRDIPVPVSELSEWYGSYYVTSSGEWWSYNGWDSQWQLIPLPPWLPISVDQDVPEPLTISAYPNPFNPSTTIEFTLPAFQHVCLVVHDVSGELVTILADVVMQPGPHKLIWDGRDNDGQEMASGVYFYRLEAGDERQSGKMVLVR